jgi:hypothetical protein
MTDLAPEILNWHPIPDYAWHCTIQEFMEACQPRGMIINSDGIGFYASATRETDKAILPSEIAKGDGYYDKRFTHVCWYNA